jgi:hypothetical protein
MKVKISSLFCSPFECYDFYHGIFYKDGIETCFRILKQFPCEESKKVEKCIFKEKVIKFLEDKRKEL